DHMVADFMVGRDFGFGGLLGLNQVKFGIRVADLRARQSVQAQHALQSFAPGFEGSVVFASGAALNLNTRSEFLGVGPRLAAEGMMPLGGPWGLDWGGGVAVLFGEQRFKADVNGVFASASVTGGGTAFTFSGNACTTTIHTSGFGTIHPLLGCTSNKAVFNADASLALSYAITPRAKLSAGVRFDGYWHALRTLDATLTNGSPAGLHNEDRFYWGPFLTLTA